MGEVDGKFCGCGERLGACRGWRVSADDRHEQAGGDATLRSNVCSAGGHLCRRIKPWAPANGLQRVREAEDAQCAHSNMGIVPAAHPALLYATACSAASLLD